MNTILFADLERWADEVASHFADRGEPWCHLDIVIRGGQNAHATTFHVAASAMVGNSTWVARQHVCLIAPWTEAAYEKAKNMAHDRLLHILQTVKSTGWRVVCGALQGVNWNGQENLDT